MRKRIIVFALNTVTLILLLSGLYFLMRRTGLMIPCVFKSLFGISCPGCGNTRAVFALMRGDFGGAWDHNPLFPLEFSYIGWVYSVSSLNYIKKGKFSYSGVPLAVDISVVVLLFVWTVVRNVLGI